MKSPRTNRYLNRVWKYPAVAPVFNPFMLTGAFNICCPRDCVSRHNGGTSGAPLKPLRDDSALRRRQPLSRSLDNNTYLENYIHHYIVDQDRKLGGTFFFQFFFL